MENKKIHKVSKENVKLSLSNIFWAFKELFIISKGEIILFVIVSIVTVLIPIGSAYFYAKGLDAIIETMNSGITSVFDVSLNSNLFKYFSIGILFQIFSSIASEVNWYLRTKFSVLRFREFDIKVFNKMATMDVQQYENEEMSKSLKKVQDTAWKIKEVVWTSISFIKSAVIVIVTGYLSFKIAPIPSLIVIIFAFPSIVFNTFHIKRWWKWYEGQIDDS